MTFRPLRTQILAPMIRLHSNNKNDNPANISSHHKARHLPPRSHKLFNKMSSTFCTNCAALVKLRWISIHFPGHSVWIIFFRCNATKLIDTVSVPGGRFKNAYELLNLRTLKIPMLYKNRIFQCMGKIFCVEFQRVPLKFHTKYLTHTLKDVNFIHRWNFKSS